MDTMNPYLKDLHAFADMLQACNIVDEEAVYDPGEYDGEVTMQRIETAHRRMVEAETPCTPPECPTIADLLPPRDIIEAAERVKVWMETNGYRNWQLDGICDRRIATERNELAAWKDGHMKVKEWWAKIDRIVREHPDTIIGRKVADEAARLIRERDEALQIIARCEMWFSTHQEGRTMQLICQQALTTPGPQTPHASIPSNPPASAAASTPDDTPTPTP